MKREYSDAEALEIIERRDQTQFKYLFETCPQPIAFVSKDGKFLKVNQALCAFVEYSGVELQDKTFTEITHIEDNAIDWANLRKLERGESDAYSMVKRYITKTNKVVKLILTVFPVRDGNDNLIYYVSHIVPIEQIQNDYGEAHKSEQSKTISMIIGDIIIEYWQTILVILMTIGGGYVFLNNLNNNLKDTNEMLKELLGDAAQTIIEENESNNQ